jgi:hypothetical protein
MQKHLGGHSLHFVGAPIPIQMRVDLYNWFANRKKKSVSEIGLLWEDVKEGRPDTGTEVHCPKLVEALQSKIHRKEPLEFTKETLHEALHTLHKDKKLRKDR